MCISIKSYVKVKSLTLWNDCNLHNGFICIFIINNPILILQSDGCLNILVYIKFDTYKFSSFKIKITAIIKYNMFWYIISSLNYFDRQLF